MRRWTNSAWGMTRTLHDQSDSDEAFRDVATWGMPRRHTTCDAAAVQLARPEAARYGSSPSPLRLTRRQHVPIVRPPSYSAAINWPRGVIRNTSIEASRQANPLARKAIR